MKKDVIQLSDHFTLGRLFRFCLPSVVMMVFTSIYELWMATSCPTSSARLRSQR